MFLNQLSSAGALPALEMTMRFAGQRQRLIAHNVANLETPNFQPVDVSPRKFQRLLADAIDERRGRNGGAAGNLNWNETREVQRGRSGAHALRLDPRTASNNIMFHDRNNRDLERTMQSMVENAAAFRVASDLMRSRVSLLRETISERVT